MHEVPIQEYEGPKTHDMPRWAATQSTLPLGIFASRVISVSRARKENFQFLTIIISLEKTPEFGVYNTSVQGNKAIQSKPQTKAVYLPLRCKAQAEPTTMLIAMVEAQQLTNATGQIYTIFTNY